MMKLMMYERCLVNVDRNVSPSRSLFVSFHIILRNMETQWPADN